MRSWSQMTVRVGVSYAAIPYGIALYTCECGATALEPDLAHGAPEGWVETGADVHLCQKCAGSRAGSDEAAPPPP